MLHGTVDAILCEWHTILKDVKYKQYKIWGTGKCVEHLSAIEVKLLSI